jgi:hypothetical protein
MFKQALTKNAIYSVMIQGPIMLALTDVQNSQILRWGPQNLIYNSSDCVLVLLFPEYEHNIVFPADIQLPQLYDF